MAVPTEAQYPLDALTPRELETFRKAMTASGHADGAVYPYVGLAEPDKAAVLGSKPGAAGDRRAFAIVRVGGATTTAVVDLQTAKVVSWTPQPGVQAGFTSNDFAPAVNAAKADSRVLAALAKRRLGVADVSLVAFAGGSSTSAGEQGHRLVRVVPYLAAGAGELVSRPVEGIMATVDVDTATVLTVSDSGVVPLPATTAPAPVRQRPALDPVGFTSAKRPNVKVDGVGLSWAGWSLRWRSDRRAGIELDDVSFDVGSGRRRVLYEAGLGDLFVPYQDPSPAWAERTLLDSAEFGMGSTLTSLQPGVDCPADARFMDVTIPDDAANAALRPAALCVFERPTGAPAYRHQTSGRLETELVLRSISTIGNYDYIIDYVLGADGSMRFHVYAAGVVLEKGVDADTADEAHTEGVDEHGVLVGNRLLAVNHDHYVNFRLDLDVGQTSNRLVRQRLVDEAVSGGSDRSTIWKVQEHMISGTKEAAYTPDPQKPERVLVQSTAADGPLGHHPGYEIDFGDSVAVASAATATDPGSRRGGWASQTLWVTPWAADEQFASGLFVPDGSATVGLPAWAAENRSIADTDLVAWVTVGFHHIVRTEDLPQMPAHEGGFGLRPVDMFATNPWLDIAAS